MFLDLKAFKMKLQLKKGKKIKVRKKKNMRIVGGGGELRRVILKVPSNHTHMNIDEFRSYVHPSPTHFYFKMLVKAQPHSHT